MRIVITILLFLLVSTPLISQYNNITFDNFTVETGLTHNYVDCIYQDSKGWIWLGTGMSIERFDGIKFKQYGLRVNDSTIKKGLLVRHFFEHSSGKLFVCTEDYGLGCLNRDKDIFEPLEINEKKILTGISTKHIDEDSEGNLWVASKRGVYKINFEEQSIETITYNPENRNSLSSNYVRKVLVDERGCIWIGTIQGLNVYNPRTGIIDRYGNTNSLLSDDILDIFIENSSKIWVGTANNGIVIINKDKRLISRFELDEGNERCLKVNTIVPDKTGNYWIGTRGGLYIYNSANQQISHYENNVLDEFSLVHNSILGILEDKKGDIWIGTRGGLSYIAKEKQAFTLYSARPNNNKYLNNNEIFAVWVDKKENIWLGTERGGINIYNKATGTFSYLTTESTPALAKNCIKSIVPYNDRYILIGTFNGGLNIYDLQTNTIEYYLHNDNPESISGNVVWDICIDNKNNIWLGTDKGLVQFNFHDKTFTNSIESKSLEGFAFIECDSENDLWMGTHDLVIYRPGHGIINEFEIKTRNFFEDSKGQSWIATEDRGIILIDKHKGEISTYGEPEGLVSRMAYCILEDNNANLWISTANGLSCFNPETEEFTNYGTQDGLHGNQFLYNSAWKKPNGELLFGGMHGLNIFNPENIVQNNYTPPVYITGLKIFNEPVTVGKSNNSILKKSITETDYLEIPYKFNVLTFEFAALNYTNSNENKYKYKMEGFDNNWIEIDEQHSATYTNLNPGNYTFLVKGSNDNNIWNEESTTLKIKILPPYYKTIWFRAILLFLTGFIVFVIVHYIIKRRDLKRALVFEKEKAVKIHELDRFKLQFFTNISHEIKTPLTLIISPLERILRVDMSKEEIKENLTVMQRNAHHLMKLINQLLDYRKLEAGKLNIELKKGDIVQFCNETFLAFKEGFKEAHLSYKFKSVQDEIFTHFDPDKLKKIIDNLLSNAIKYNKPHGNISMLLSLVIDENSDDKADEQYIKIVIKDTGTGIPEKSIGSIFNRFYSAHSNSEGNSTGIGLAFTKELVKLHKGKIFVESEVDKGTSFTVMLPYITEHNPIEVKSEEIIETQIPENYEELENDVGNKKIMLIAEDNKDVRQFLRSHFNKDYLVYEAENGKQALEIATKAIPNVIISDIMMPQMDGKELCEKIKKDERTSHIPFIHLSALSSKEHVMESLVKGADDYITKPFDISLLETKIDNLLSMQNSLRDKYSKEMILEPSNVTITSPDEKFLQKAVKIVEKNIDDPNLDIDKFVNQIGISRMQLYRKMSALTNMTVKEFINDIRLKRAYQMLKENKLNISEVAYAVGFNDTSYFGKCIRKKYGMSASEIAKSSKFKSS